jgi:glycosyltransferase involved in cell wall biosynthesis
VSQTRRALFIAPVMPDETGHGIAMRAGMFLEALARDHEVSLLVLPLAGPADPAALPDLVARHAARVVVVPTEGRVDPLFALISRVKDPLERTKALLAYPRPAMCRFATGDTIAEAARRLAGIGFDLVHVHRLYMAPFAVPFLGSGRAAARPVCVLDLDDDEPRTRRGLSALHASRGQTEAAALEAGEAEKYTRLERDFLPRFDRILVCAEADRAELTARFGLASVEIIPNAVRVPPRSTSARGAGAFCFLLVGSFGYFPNEDAALFFCQEVWPQLVVGADRPVRVSIVGSWPSPAVLRFGATVGITVTGKVPSVGPYYAGAHVAINPIRAGGGTRIKAIEAFAHGVPLVSTSVGVEGLGAEHERHVLIADSPGDFAAACLRLLRDPGLAATLAERAHALYCERYALPRVAGQIRERYRAFALTARAE